VLRQSGVPLVLPITPEPKVTGRFPEILVLMEILHCIHLIRFRVPSGRCYTLVYLEFCFTSDFNSVYIHSFCVTFCRNEAEFLLVSKRDSVLRINLNDFSRVETLPLGKVRAVIAMDFNIKNNSIFWSDVTTDHIMVCNAFFCISSRTYICTHVIAHYT